MDLEFTSEQELLRETVRGVCNRHCGLDVVRKTEDDPIGYPEVFWAQLNELGITGMVIPEEYGGSGMSMLDAVIVYEEFGRAVAPSPHFVSSVISAGVIAAAGSELQRREWLPRIASGTVIVTPAWLEPGHGFGSAGVQLDAVPVAGGGWRLTGTKRHVAFARAASVMLVLARAASGVVLLLVDTGAPGVTLTQQMSVASDTQYRVDFEDVLVGADRLVGTGWDVWDQVMHDGAILLAAQASGGARQALDLAAQYASDRFQFGKPLGAFQAIAHYLADAATAIDGAEALVWEAGWARSEGRSVSLLAPMAKLFACQTYRDVTATAQQIYGGMGFTLECDIQLYFRRAKTLQLSWWDTRYLEELVATQALDQ
jgi:alkylation response protein AidB-like acyl-CoA dehydrogenase